MLVPALEFTSALASKYWLIQPSFWQGAGGVTFTYRVVFWYNQGSGKNNLIMMRDLLGYPRSAMPERSIGGRDRRVACFPCKSGLMLSPKLHLKPRLNFHMQPPLHLCPTSISRRRHVAVQDGNLGILVLCFHLTLRSTHSALISHRR